MATAATVAAPSIVKAQGPDQHALAEHLAVEGYLSRIRARLRQEGQRHDRRRPQDRGAARRRRRACIRPARRGLERNARRRPWRARLPLRQADRARAVGLGPGLSRWTPTCCWPGTNTAAARSCSPSSMHRSAPNVVSFPYGPMPTQPLGWFKKPVTKVDDLKGLKFRTVGISIDVFTGHGRRGQRAAGRRDRVGDGPRPARCGRVQQRLVRPRRWAFADVSKVCMLQSYHQNAEQFEITVQQGEIRRTAGQDEGDHRQCGRGGLAGHAVEGDRPLLAGLRRAADQGQRQVLQDAGRNPEAAARGLRRGREEEGGGKSAVQGDRRIADRLRQAGDAMGAGHGREPPHGVRSLLRARTRRRRRSDVALEAGKAPFGS